MINRRGTNRRERANEKRQFVEPQIDPIEREVVARTVVKVAKKKSSGLASYTERRKIILAAFTETRQYGKFMGVF